jgi:hypothetical protein
MSFFFNKEPVNGIEVLLAKKFPLGAFASPYRSTVPLVALVKDDQSKFEKIATSCGSSHPFSIHFEYTVGAPGVGGNPSHTDAMILTPHLALALEAKWTEPRYETVFERLEKSVAALVKADQGVEDNASKTAKHRAAQQAVINAWLDPLGLHRNIPVWADKPGKAIYQMVHRAASASATASKTASSPSLVYVHFQPRPAGVGATTDQYRVDLRRLHKLMGSPANFPFYLAEVPLWPTEAFHKIASLPRGDNETDKSVRTAIGETRLFDFDDPKIERI